MSSSSISLNDQEIEFAHKTYPITFTIMKRLSILSRIVGLKGIKHFLFMLYKHFLIINAFLYVLLYVWALVSSEEAFFEKFNNAFLFFSVIISHFKLLILHLSERKIIMIIKQAVHRDWMIARDEDEAREIRSTLTISRIIAFLYWGNVYTIAGALIIQPIVCSLLNVPMLWFWTFCDVSSARCYWSTVISQGIAYGSYSSASGSTELFIFMTIHNIILRYRLLVIRCRKITRQCTSGGLRQEEGAMKECVRAHNQILQYIELVDETFRPILVIQFFVSIFVICTNVYVLTESGNYGRVDNIVKITHVITVTFQTFFYCLHGNMLQWTTNEFSRDIFTSDWYRMSKKAQDYLRFMIHRSLKPIYIFDSFVATINLTTFLRILKIAYSIFNILRK